MMTAAKSIAHLRLAIDLVRHASQHPDHHAHREDEDDFLIEGDRAQRQQHHHRTEGDAAAEDAPVGRALLARLQTDEERARDRYERDDEPEQKDGRVRQPLRQPAGNAGDGKDAERQGEPAQHLHHAEVVVDLGFGAGAAVGVLPGHDLRAHGIGDHVLQNGARNRQEGSHDVERVGAHHRDPAAGSTGQQDETDGDQTGAHEDIDASLRAEHRHGVDHLAEHHLDGPRQA